MSQKALIHLSVTNDNQFNCFADGDIVDIVFMLKKTGGNKGFKTAMYLAAAHLLAEEGKEITDQLSDHLFEFVSNSASTRIKASSASD